MKKILFRLANVVSMVLVIAAVSLRDIPCMFFWGQPKMPQSLKDFKK